MPKIKKIKRRHRNNVFALSSSTSVCFFSICKKVRKVRYILKTRGGAEGSEGIEDISEDKNKAKKPTGVSLREEVSRWHVQTEL